MMKIKTIRNILIPVLLLAAMNLHAADYKASLFGVKSDGSTLNTRSIQKAIDFISENGGGRLVFYVGRYLTGTIQLRSNVTVQLEEGAILAGVSTIYDYRGLDGHNTLIAADSVINSGITGKGVIEGGGKAVLQSILEQKAKGHLSRTAEEAAPGLIRMTRCENITLSGINLRDPANHVLNLLNCKGVQIQNVTIQGNAAPATVGIEIRESEAVELNSLFFDTSGKEVVLSGNNRNITAKNCVSKTGKKIAVKP